MVHDDTFYQALQIAIEGHSGQKRLYTGEDYIQHPIRVMVAVAQESTDITVLSAALTHDLFQNTAITYEQLSRRTTTAVADLTRELTNVYTDKAFPHMNRAERKAAECERYRTVSTGAKLIKRFDRADNLPSIIAHDPEFSEIYLAETRALLKVIS